MCAKLERSTKIWQFFQSTLPATFRCHAERDWKSRVCSTCKLWIYMFVKRQTYKISVRLWWFMWKDCNSKVFVDIATAGRHRGLSTIHKKHNVFHQSKLGRDGELQNTHIVLLRSLRDVMQVSKVGAQLGFGSKLVDWYQDATSVP